MKYRHTKKKTISRPGSESKRNNHLFKIINNIYIGFTTRWNIFF